MPDIMPPLGPPLPRPSAPAMDGSEAGEDPGDDIERCRVCGFAWGRIEPAEAPDRIRPATVAFAALLRAHPDVATVRPTPDRWSALEYGGHARDVLLNLRDRIVRGAAEDKPVPHGMHGTPRIELGLYAADADADIATITRTGCRTRGAPSARTTHSTSRRSTPPAVSPRA